MVIKVDTASWNTLKLFLAVGTPIQNLFSGIGDTHFFCNRQALYILKNDGKKIYAQFLNNYLELINKGVGWADKGWKNFSHYFDPVTGQGFGPWPDAKTECSYFFKKAETYWYAGSKKKAIFFLGAALHLAQDLCVPYHARGIAFNGHNEYEKWVQENYQDYSVYSDGIYTNSTPESYIEQNAKTSRLYLPYVLNADYKASYRLATRVLLPLAQRTTAGFLSLFLDRVKFDNNHA
ncbi:Phospholipase C [Pelotomaculum propionicicum]|uniref:Phospholipase C n=1 Tax=Pelotomaculum propionicicum TaxID=258475 RepID=A0A4Y7RUY3_9FIRM|nr:Phospholipase C [Pelotomaculum propionicicum]